MFYQVRKLLLGGVGGVLLYAKSVRNLFVVPVGLYSDGGLMGFLLSVDPYRIDQISSFVFRRTGYFGYHLLSFECAAFITRQLRK